jgi:hypothetical protein
MTKKIGFLGLIFICVIFLKASAAPIQSYQELASAMRAGNRFVVLLNLQQCTGKSNMPIGYFIPSAMLLIPSTDTNAEYIATSHLQFTDYSGNPAYEYIKFTFNPDNSVIVRTLVYEPQTFKPTSPARIINCGLDKGVEIHAVEE